VTAVDAPTDVVPRVLVVGQKPAAQAHPGPQAPIGADDDAGERPIVAKADSSRRASAWPDEQVAGADDSALPRRSSNVSSQVSQRYS
jgi:hypothetical protein